MDQAADAGLGDGVGISLRGEGPELVGVGIARSSLPGSGRRKRQDYNFLGDAYLLSTCLHETYRDLIIKSARAAVSTREHDILSWGAERKTDEEISIILNITVNTVPVSLEEYLQKAGGERSYLRHHQGASPARLPVPFAAPPPGLRLVNRERAALWRVGLKAPPSWSRSLRARASAKSGKTRRTGNTPKQAQIATDKTSSTLEK